MKNIIIFSFILLLSAVVWNGCSVANSEPDSMNGDIPAKAVKTTEAQAVDFKETIFAVGQLGSAEELKLSFKTGGIVKKILVSEGQSVKKGQLLAELDLEEISAQNQQAKLGIQQAEISISDAELAVSKAQRDYDNIKALYADSVATLNQLKDAKLQLENTQNQLEAAQTNLNFNKRNVDIASFNLEYSRIVAPTSGVILQKVAESNELVGPGTPVLLFGTRDKAQVVRVSLTDKDIIHVQLGDKAKVRFDAYPGIEFTGVVQELGSMADPFTGTYEVEIRLENQGKKLLSGFIGQVDIEARSGQPMVRIPVDALLNADRNRGEVFLSVNDTAQRKMVSIFRMDGDDLLIMNGVDPGDEVIVSGGAYLKNGDPVSSNR